MSNISYGRLAERAETKLRERAGFMRDAGHIDDAELDEDAADLIQSLRVQGGVRVKPLHWSVSEVFGKYKARGSGVFGEFCAFTLDGLTDAQITEKKERYETEYRRAILSSLEASPAPVSEEMVVRVMSWVRDDVLPAYGITHNSRASDPEMIEGCRAALAAKGAAPEPAPVSEEMVKQALLCLDGEPEYHHSGMGCGLEDRNIHDRYEAMQYGWDQAMERVYSEHINPAIEVLTAALAARGGQ